MICTLPNTGGCCLIGFSFVGVGFSHISVSSVGGVFPAKGGINENIIR
jgi:hypothetical protein